MAETPPDQEIAAFLKAWIGTAASGDADAAGRLRAPGYQATFPDGRTVSREQELAMIAAPALRLESSRAENVSVRRQGERAILRFDYEFVLRGRDADKPGRFSCRLVLARSGAGWQAERLRATDADGKPRRDKRRGPLAVAKSLFAGPVRRALARGMGGLSPAGHIPFAGGADFVVPARRADAGRCADDLPVPPPRLWPGDDYGAHGKAQVETMLEIVRASGVFPAEGDRILDFGCGAGRMIRHLRELAGRCEIWGADISAEHIFWCRDHLDPPFHFLTSTTAPHLPFADGSFRLIYAGSVFTHIVELAEAWLLELRRLLAADGRLYVTIHDRHTVELFGRWPHSGVKMVEAIKAKRVFRSAGEGFGMLAVGRDADPQVFYDTDYFARLAAPGLEIVSVTPEAYFYQTAVLMKPT